MIIDRQDVDYPIRRETVILIPTYIYMDRVMSRESRLGPICGGVTAQKKKAGVGLLLNGALLSTKVTQ